MQEIWILGAAALLLLSILLSKAANRLGIPSLLVILGVGMLAGSDGILGISFDNFALTNTLGNIALMFILFSGGVDTSWKTIKPVLRRGIILSTVGVFASAALVACFSRQFLHFSWVEGFLLGVMISSTDAAAVFTLLRGKNLHLQGNVAPLLELESGSNDPMAVFLTLGLIELIQHPHTSLWSLVPFFLLQMGVGSLLGYVGGKALVFVINRIRLEFEGLYPVLTIACVLLLFEGCYLLKGNGFLAVYIAGMVLGNANFLHKKSLALFHGGLSWLMQIAMFLLLGLLAFPKEFSPWILKGIGLSVFLVFVARPISVYLCLAFSSFSFREQTVVAWTGLRGAVPIVLATYPLLKQVPSLSEARTLFHLVFFVVVLSVLLQGTTIPWVAKWLKVLSPLQPKFRHTAPYQTTNSLKKEMVEMVVPEGSSLIGWSLLDLSKSTDVFTVLIHRNGDVIVPRGSTTLEAKDQILLLGQPQEIENFQKLLEKKK